MAAQEIVSRLMIRSADKWAPPVSDTGSEKRGRAREKEKGRNGPGQFWFWTAGEVCSAWREGAGREEREIGLGWNDHWAERKTGSAWVREMVLEFWLGFFKWSSNSN